MKCYGTAGPDGAELVVSSGNFTGPGMSQNVEMSVYLDREETLRSGFSWTDLVSGINSQDWDIYDVTDSPDDPVWSILYSEVGPAPTLDTSREQSLLLTLGHSDTVRINAESGTPASAGTQYFWLSTDCFDFFPPLIERNTRGVKATYSAVIALEYVDLGITDDACRVTFEAENNKDFRLGTGRLRGTGLCEQGDLAVISRIGEDRYRLKIHRKSSADFMRLAPHANRIIGAQGKKYGFVPNDIVEIS
jgi:hypothetical protein